MTSKGTSRKARLGSGTPKARAARPPQERAETGAASIPTNSGGDRLVVETPMPELDSAARAAAALLDALWRAPSFVPHPDAGGVTPGWRLWYGPLCAGEHERVREAIRFHLGHLLDGPTGCRVAPRVSPDGKPEDTGDDLNQAFLAQLRAYWSWTGDLETLRAAWPVVQGCLAYERAELDPDDDGLYANRGNTWANAGREYGPACTQASALVHAALGFAADLARALGEDPAPYGEAAEQTRAAVMRSLWMARAGRFAEYRDADGALHGAAQASAAYLPVECGLTDTIQGLRALDDMVRRLERDGGQLRVNDWFPRAGYNGRVSPNEALAAALACLETGDVERGWRLLGGALPAFGGGTPPEGEAATGLDAGDAASVLARCVVEGLFGLKPDVPNGRLSWSPRLPMEWPRAALRTAGYTLSYERSGTRERYLLEMPRDLAAVLHLPLRFDRLRSVTLNGKPAAYRGETGMGHQEISVRAPASRRLILEIVYSHRARFRVSAPPDWVVTGDALSLATTAGSFGRVEDPEGALRGARTAGAHLQATAGEPGRRTFFARLRLSHSEVLQPVPLEIRPAFELLGAELCPDRPPELGVTLRCNRPERVPTPIEVLYAGRTYRARLAARARGAISPAGEAEVFRFAIKNPEELTPGTLLVQVTVRAQAAPVVLSGETRCWDLLERLPELREEFEVRCEEIELAKARSMGVMEWWRSSSARSADACGQPATLPPFSAAPLPSPTLPHSITPVLHHSPPLDIPIGRPARKIYLTLANRTSDLQAGLAQARVEVLYEDGEQEGFDLRGPEEIDDVCQHYARHAAPQPLPIEAPGAEGRPLRLHADVLDLPLTWRESVERVIIRCLTRDTQIGVLGVTLWA